MKNLKLFILGCGVLGLVSLLLELGGLRDQFANDPFETIVLLAGFGLPTLMGIMGIVKPPFQGWQAGIALAGFVVISIRGRMWQLVPDLLDLPMAARVAVIAAVGGIVVSALALAKPEDRV